jgi:hypothetical protein
MPQQDPSFFIPDVETYFKGHDKERRKKGLRDDFQDVKFFITEANLPKRNKTA